MINLVQKLELMLMISVIILIVFGFITFMKRFFPGTDKNRQLSTKNIYEKSNNDKNSEVIGKVSALLGPSAKSKLGIDVDMHKPIIFKEEDKNDTESTMFKIDPKILEASRYDVSLDFQTDEAIDHQPSLDGEDDEDHYKMYIKYKRKCTEFQKSNTLLKKEMMRMKKIITDSDAKKDTMKDLIRKLDLKLKQKSSKIVELEEKTNSIDRDKGLISELSSTVSDLRNKLITLETSQAQLDVIIKIKSMYRTIRTMFLSSMRFNDEVSMDNPICQDIEHDDPIKILSYIEKMMHIIIKNSKTDHKYDDNCSLETFKYNQKECVSDCQSVLRIVVDNNDIDGNIQESGDQNDIELTTKHTNTCIKCDDMKSRLKKLVKTIKVLQKEVIKAQRTETFVNNIECLLSMYSDDKNENIKSITDPRTKHDFILKAVGNCFKKWCECKQKIDVLTCKIDGLTVVEVNHKELQRRFEESVKANRDMDMKLQIFSRWKQQILSILKDLHTEESDVICLDPSKDDETTLVKISNCIKCCINDCKTDLPKSIDVKSNHHIDKCTIARSSLIQIIEMYKQMVDTLKSDIGTDSSSTSSYINIESLEVDPLIIVCDQDKCDQEAIDKYVQLIKSKITHLFTSVKNCYHASQKAQNIQPDQCNILSSAVYDQMIRIINRMGTLSLHHHIIDTHTQPFVPSCDPLQFNPYVETIIRGLNEVSNTLNHKKSEACETPSHGNSETYSNQPIHSDTNLDEQAINSIEDQNDMNSKSLNEQENVVHRLDEDTSVDLAQTDLVQIDQDFKTETTNDGESVDALFTEYTKSADEMMTMRIKLEPKVVDPSETTDDHMTPHNTMSIDIKNKIKQMIEKNQSLKQKIIDTLTNHFCNGECTVDDDKEDNNLSNVSHDPVGCRGCMIKFNNEHSMIEMDDDSDSEYEEQNDHKHNNTPISDELLTDDKIEDRLELTALNVDLSIKANVHKCMCDIHKKYCHMIPILERYQKAHTDLMSCFDIIELNITSAKQKMIPIYERLGDLSNNSSDRSGDASQIRVNGNFSLLPEYAIYFECHGHPAHLEDYLKIDHDEIEKIRKSLEDRPEEIGHL